MTTTTKIQLTDTPQLIASGACYLQSRNGDFVFVFGTPNLADETLYHWGSDVYTDGSFGDLYAWKRVQQEVTLIVTQ